MPDHILLYQEETNRIANGRCVITLSGLEPVPVQRGRLTGRRMRPLANGVLRSCTRDSRVGHVSDGGER